MSIEGIENAQKVKMVYIFDKSEKVLKSVAYASRLTGIGEGSIRYGLNPIKKRKFIYEGKEIVFRIVK